MKNIIKNCYNNYISNITNINNNEVYQYNITKDVANFIINYQKKYKKKINFLDIIQLQEDDLISISKITLNF